MDTQKVELCRSKREKDARKSHMRPRYVYDMRACKHAQANAMEARSWCYSRKCGSVCRFVLASRHCWRLKAVVDVEEEEEGGGEEEKEEEEEEEEQEKEKEKEEEEQQEEQQEEKQEQEQEEKK